MSPSTGKCTGHEPRNGTDAYRGFPPGCYRESAVAGHDPSAYGSFAQLLGRARAGDAHARGRLLQQFWVALLHDARRDLPLDLQAKGGASDLVQETMLDAHKDFEQFRGCTAQEFFAWLQCSLRHNFSNFVRAYRRYAKREVKRE